MKPKPVVWIVWNRDLIMPQPLVFTSQGEAREWKRGAEHDERSCRTLDLDGPYAYELREKKQ